DDEPARTAGALLSGYVCRPASADALVGMVGAITALHDHRGELSGLARSLCGLVDLEHLGQSRLIVSSGAGAELGGVFGHEGALALPPALERLRALLEQVLPNVEVTFDEFLQRKADAAFSGVVVVPPLGLRLSGRNVSGFELSKKSGKAISKVSAETLYVEHALGLTAVDGLLVAVLPEGLLSSAGHAHFREWLLEHARLLAVVSLPAGTCFDSTGVKCSVVILRKEAPADDYPILMIDVEDGDLEAELASARSSLDEFLNREVAACA
ncbi:MAG: N-6 DNA methylase, partial [Acidobacteriota bacterium]